MGVDGNVYVKEYICFISKRTNGGGVEEDMDDGSVRGGRPFCMFMAQSSFSFSVSLWIWSVGRFMAQWVSCYNLCRKLLLP